MDKKPTTTINMDVVKFDQFGNYEIQEIADESFLAMVGGGENAGSTNVGCPTVNQGCVNIYKCDVAVGEDGDEVA